MISPLKKTTKLDSIKRKGFIALGFRKYSPPHK